MSKTDAGAVKVTLFSIDQGGRPISASSASFQDGALKYVIQQLDQA